jgi:hypothetical protein
MEFTGFYLGVTDRPGVDGGPEITALSGHHFWVINARNLILSAMEKGIGSAIGKTGDGGTPDVGCRREFPRWPRILW